MAVGSWQNLVGTVEQTGRREPGFPALWRHERPSRVVAGPCKRPACRPIPCGNCRYS